MECRYGNPFCLGGRIQDLDQLNRLSNIIVLILFLEAGIPEIPMSKNTMTSYRLDPRSHRPPLYRHIKHDVAFKPEKCR